MKLKLLCLVLFCSISIASFAQNLWSVKGRVVDTASTSILAGTSVSVLRAKDSTLVKFTRALDNGIFELNNIPKGKYILLVSYPKYADFVDHFTLDSIQQHMDYGKINLTGKARLLNEVIIKGNMTAIKIKGDTTEYNASAYKIRPNDKVEDLLKQLQGIQVDMKGKITAQGVAVNKVLVDGEEFFGDDPTLVTQNLRSDMVDKVQLYDKKSDQAVFTGIDDGQKTKTINIQLKEDKKNGYFGKINTGLSTDDYYQTQAMFNKFNGKRKISIYGVTGNNGQVNLGREDLGKLGAATNREYNDDDILTVYNNDFETYNGQYYGEGLPVARSGGFHFDNKWNADKEALNTNYKMGSIRVKGVNETITQNTLATGVINSNSDQTYDNDMFRQKLDATYEIKLDTTLTLKVAIDRTLKNSKTQNDYGTLSSRGDNSLLNKSIRSLKNDGKDQLFNANAFIAKRLRKKGRTLSLNLSQSVTKSNTDGYLNSTNSFYNAAGSLDSIANVNQYKVNDITSNVFRSNLSYTEPLTKSLTLIFSYGLNLNNGKSDRQSFNQSATGNYDVIDYQYSNNYSLDQVTNQGGAFLNFKKGKYTVNLGSKISNVDFKQTDNYTDKSYSRSFINYRPQVRVFYSASQQKSISFQYSGSSNQPTLDQIQPIRVNNDPLNITLGNPALRPSFNSNLNISYNSYKVITGMSVYLSASYNFVTNPIVRNVLTDAAGKNTFQSVNLSDKIVSGFALYTTFGKKVNSDGLWVGLDLGANGNSFYNYINNTLNNTGNYIYNGSFSLSKYADKNYSFRLSLGPTYNTSTASVQKFLNSSGWGFNGNGQFYINLPFKMGASSDVSYQYKGKTKVFDTNFSKVIWNAAVSKKILKSEALKFILSVDDLLNQNIGFNRSAFENMITQSSYTTIKRYFTVTAIWDFNKMGGNIKK